MSALLKVRARTITKDSIVKRRKWKHGSAGGYNNHACRCARCREAWRSYTAARRARAGPAVAALAAEQAVEARRWRIWSFSIFTTDGGSLCVEADDEAVREWRARVRAPA